MAYSRITVDPRQMGGVACIRGLRIPVATVVGMIAEGMGEDEILRDYPDLEREDIREALRFASEAVRERELVQVRGFLAELVQDDRVPDEVRDREHALELLRGRLGRKQLGQGTGETEQGFGELHASSCGLMPTVGRIPARVRSISSAARAVACSSWAREPRSWVLSLRTR